jgi:hypothetical protein
MGSRFAVKLRATLFGPLLTSVLYEVVRWIAPAVAAASRGAGGSAAGPALTAPRVPQRREIRATHAPR